ncbi:Uncharacterised protein [Mycobacteroides abscessus subsp. abscessus]|nr:Uncharacterised protein [Mycobacteroides abscessus subsp. abscessus]
MGRHGPLRALGRGGERLTVLRGERIFKLQW